MPWIDLVLPSDPDTRAKERIKAELAAVMLEVAGKDEKGLFVTFREAKGFFRAGSAGKDCAVVDVRYIGTFPLEKKREITKRISELLARETGTDPQALYVPFTELSSEDWGRKGGNFS